MKLSFTNNKPSQFTKAVPVWAEGMSDVMNVTVEFRTVIEKKSEVKLTCAAASVYNVYINGEFAAAGPARTAHGYYRVDSINIGNFLKNGDNCISVRVAGYGVNSFYTLDQKPFLCAEIVSDGDVAAATGAFGFDTFLFNQRLRKTQRYSYQRAFTEVYDFGAENTPCKTVNAGERRFILRNVFYPRYEREKAKKAVMRGSVCVTERQGRFKDRCLENIGGGYKGFRKEKLEIISTDFADTLDFVPGEYESSENGFALFEFEKDLSGLIQFNVKCEGDVTLTAVFDEILTDGAVDFERMEAANVIIWRLKKGEYTLSSFEPYTMKYLNISHLGAPCTVSDVKMIRFGYPEIISQPKTENKKLLSVYRAAVETFRQNTFDIFTDCPSRERAGWLCDSYFTAEAEFFFTGKNEVERNFLENFIIAQRFPGMPEGVIPMCYPADFVNANFIPAWTFWFILELKRYYERTGDLTLILNARDKVYALFSYFEKYENEYGLLENLEGWLFIEWSRSTEYMKDVNFPTNMLYAYAKKIAGKMYGDKKLYESGNKLCETVRRLSYKDGFFCDNAVRKNGVLNVESNYSECCQYYAFFTETADFKSFDTLWQILVNDFGPQRRQTKKYENVCFANAFVGNLLRLELLSRRGLYERCLNEIEGYYYYMAEKTGTLWEHDKATASCCHGFASYIACIIDRCLN